MTPERIAELRRTKVHQGDEYIVDECIDDIERLRSIVDSISLLVYIVARDQRENPDGTPSIYQRGDKWRYHTVACGNSWEDGDTPLEAAQNCKRIGAKP